MKLTLRRLSVIPFFSIFFLSVRPAMALGLTCPVQSLDQRGFGTIPLFSALPLVKTEFARHWTQARKELSREFPTLRFETPENLHVTLVYMGMGWDPKQADLMEKYGLNGPDVSSAAVTLKGHPELFGLKKEVAVLELTPVPEEWSTRLMKDRQTMTDKGLRKKDMFDGVFRAHVSLAYASNPAQQRGELLRFENWMSSHAARFGGLDFTFDRSIVPQFFVVLGQGASTRFVPLRSYCRTASK